MKNENICIVCINVAFANAAGLQNVLDCNIAIEKLEPKGYGSVLTQKPFGLNNIPEADHYIFAGSGIMTRIDVSLLKGRKSVIITDSHYLRDTATIDSIIQNNNIEVHCMIDLWKFCKLPNKKAYFHPFLDLNVPIVKNETPTLCHSPYSKHKQSLKGTAHIERAVKILQCETTLNTDFIVDATWEECLERKAKANFFIDQLCIRSHSDNLDYVGGIGKSGLEGMLLKCLTFSSGEHIVTDIGFPPYEIVNTVEMFIFKMQNLLGSESMRLGLVEKQYEWAKKNTAPNYVVGRILEKA
jgi:hypothetical protein